MGQTGSKAARGMRLPRSHTRISKQAVAEQKSDKGREKMVTREQMLAEEDGLEEADDKQDGQLQDNLKYFINPKELVTPITPANPSENANVRALRNRREDDDVKGAGVNRVSSSDVVRMLHELRCGQNSLHQTKSAAAKYKLDEGTVAKVARFLEPVTSTKGYKGI
ncbi:hypothetical protein H4R24_005346 [Coemansia sp. RSA 988]|nr:hypothetical protein H4R24_005346 [Coemansia sp. RSA 988]